MNYSAKLLLKLLGFFILVQLLGLVTGVVIVNDINTNPYVKEAFSVSVSSEDTANAIFFFIYMLFGTLVLLSFIKFVKNPIIFKFLEVFLISTSSSIIFYAVFRLLFYFGFDQSMGLAIIAGLVLGGLKFFYGQLKNTATILSTAGVGVVFGVSLGVQPAVIFLLLLSVYDFFAVFITKHMVELATFMVKQDLAFTVTSRVNVPSKTEYGKSEEKRVDLGGGDLLAPVLLEVSLLSFSPIASAMVFIGAIISFSAFIFILYKEKNVYPALPPIVLGMFLFLSLGFLLRLY
ncbi:MAG: presenilin family intramembrane aspartyl protease [Candidatus Micrarchaeota archaeon]